MVSYKALNTTPDSPKDCTESSLGLVDASYVVLHLEYSRKSKRYVFVINMLNFV